MHRVQKRASDLGEGFAWGAETCLRFRTDLCMGCINAPQIWGRLMHGGQKRAPDSGQTFAWCAETCLSFRADFCMGCINVPQVQGIFLHGVQKRVLDFRLIFQLLERNNTIFTHTIGTQKPPVPESTHTIPSLKRLRRIGVSPRERTIPKDNILHLLFYLMVIYIENFSVSLEEIFISRLFFVTLQAR